MLDVRASELTILVSVWEAGSLAPPWHLQKPGGDVSSDCGSSMLGSATTARSRRRGGTLPSSIRLCLAGLVSALALSACTTAGATSSSNATASPAHNAATPTEASTGVQPPAAPTGLHEWVDESSDPVPAHFAWTAPSGPIDGYYFWKKGVYVDMTPPPTICGPTWVKLPAAATTYTLDAVQAEPDAYICAFNAAGTSPTVQFPRDTPLK
jgi:hypothetical protein